MKLMQAPPTLRASRPELERVFERAYGIPFPAAFELPEPRMLETVWTPSVDLTETDKEYIVRLEVPGIPKENLDVALEGNVLTLSGRREFQKLEEGEEYLWREREEGKFVRALRLPKAVQEAKIQASYEDGILAVRLPKVEALVKSKVLIK